MPQQLRSNKITTNCSPLHIASIFFLPISFLLKTCRLPSFRFGCHLGREDIHTSKHHLDPYLISLPFNYFMSLILFPPCLFLIHPGIHPLSHSRDSPAWLGTILLQVIHSFLFVLTLLQLGWRFHFLALMFPLHPLCSTREHSASLTFCLPIPHTPA